MHERPDDTPRQQLDDPVVLVLHTGRLVPKAAAIRPGTVQERVRAAIERQRQWRDHDRTA